MDEDRASDLAFRILSDYRSCLMDRSEWERRLAEWDNQYYNKVEPKSFPWDGAANFHVPITMMGVETYKPRLVEGVMGQTPPIMVVPATGALEKKKDLVESFLNWQV